MSHLHRIFTQNILSHQDPTTLYIYKTIFITFCQLNNMYRDIKFVKIRFNKVTAFNHLWYVKLSLCILQGLYNLGLKEVEVCSELKSNYFSIKVNESNNVVGLIHYTKGEEYSELNECLITLVSDLGDNVSVSSPW